jgi:predicted heme/steroid binding protein/uncharacterized membrane protein
MKELDINDLSPNNGENGNPVWVACDGKVFDLSASPLWAEGSHMGSHTAGADLTWEIDAAPHGREMLERYSQIGVLKEQEPVKKQEPSGGPWSSLLTRFPVLRRHPHPMTVHFPIVFMFSAPVCALLYLFSEVTGFETTAFYCLGAGIIFIPVAMATGYITWWLNYGAQPIRPVTIKMYLSAVLLALDAAAFAWQATVPDILHPFTWASGVYLILLILLFLIVSVIGWFGATLTFPLKKEQG